ncbi:FliH/SctL family protein [Thermodesulfitimonas sp.]
MPSSYSQRVLKGVSLDGRTYRRLVLRELNVAAAGYLDSREAEAGKAGADAADAAAQIIAEAKEEAARIREQAYREGFEAGFRDGVARGEESARGILEQARAVLAAAEAERTATIDRLEKEIIELAQEMAKRIVAAELKTNQEVVLAIIKEALTLVRDRPQVLVLVHPDDLAICQQARPQFEALLPDKAVLRILPDPAVERGGCVIDTGEGVVDATLASRWAMLLEELKG